MFQRIIKIASSVVIEIISLPVIFLLFPFAFLTSRPNLPRNCRRVTILVHGFLHNSSAWFILRQYLKRYDELGPLFTINLGNPLLSIEEYTSRLRNEIEKIRNSVPDANLEVNLVGHSMGGLVCVNYATSLPKESPVKILKIITICSPLQGTLIANIARLCECAKEMLPQSPFLQKLEGRLKYVPKELFFHIACFCDLLVPQKSTHLIDSPVHREINYFGHISCLLSPATARFILDGLRTTNTRGTLNTFNP